MSEKNNGVINLLELIKWILPFALAFVGWYVSQVVAPLDNKIKELEKDLQSYDQLVQRVTILEAEKKDRLRRIEILESQRDRIQEQLLTLMYGTGNDE